MEVLLDRMMWFPKRAVKVARIKAELTVHTVAFRGAGERIEMYEETDTLLGVPRAWGFKNMSWLCPGDYLLQDNTTCPMVDDWPSFVGEYRPGQKESVQGILKELVEVNPYGALLDARPGAGKTLMGLDVASRLRTP